MKEFSKFKKKLGLAGKKLKPGDMINKSQALLHAKKEGVPVKHEKMESKKKETKEQKNVKKGKKEEKREPKSSKKY